MQMQGPFMPLLNPKDFGAETRARLETLQAEMASGRTADAGRALASDFSAISRITHGLRVYEAKSASLSQAETWTGAAQNALERMSEASSRIGDKLAVGLSKPDELQIGSLANIADGVLSDIASALDLNVAGRSVFANGASNLGNVLDTDRLRADIATLAGAATDVPDLLQSFDNYFSAGGGFETDVLSAYPAGSVVFPLGEGDAVDVPISADDEGVRGIVKQAALVAALPSVGFALDQTGTQELTIELVTRGLNATDGLIGVQTGLGGIQQRLGQLQEGLNAERLDLEAQRNDALSADPYETATKIQAELTRLESIYAVTARRASLTLTGYLR